MGNIRFTPQLRNFSLLSREKNSYAQGVVIYLNETHLLLEYLWLACEKHDWISNKQEKEKRKTWKIVIVHTTDIKLFTERMKCKHYRIHVHTYGLNQYS